MNTDLTRLLMPLAATLLAFAGSLQMAYRKKSDLNYILLGMYLSLSYYLLYLWMYSEAILPALLYSTDNAVALLVAPYLSFYFLMISGTLKKTKIVIITPPLAAAVTFAAIVIFNMMHDSTIHFSGDSHSYFGLKGTRFVMNVVADIVVIASALYLPVRLVRFGIPLKKRNRFNIAIFVFSLMYVSAVVLITLSYVVRSCHIVTASTAIFCLLAFSFLYFSYRYPGETQFYLNNAVSARQQSEEIPEWAVPAEDRLRALFEKEYIYRDPDISLANVSKLIGISENRLSWLVNRRFSMNFRAFVNKCRVAEAKTLLRQNLSMNILEIAFYTGYNSKSVFNAAFKEECGMTPGDFRKNR